MVTRMKRLTDTWAIAQDERFTWLRLAVDRSTLPLGQQKAGGSDALRPEQRLRDPVAPLDTAIHPDRDSDLENVAQADAFQADGRRSPRSVSGLGRGP